MCLVLVSRFGIYVTDGRQSLAPVMKPKPSPSRNWSECIPSQKQEQLGCFTPSFFGTPKIRVSNE
jgi:hypothetical protein